MQLIIIGAVGLGVFGLSAVITALVLRGKRKRIEKAIRTEYEQVFSDSRT